MRDNNLSPSPPPTVDFGTPSGQVGPILPAPNGGGLDAEPPAQPSIASPPHPSNLRRSTTILHSLHRELTSLGSRVPQTKPLILGFERPNIARIATLTILCLITYPAFYILTLVANDRSLFVVRAIVGLWGWVAGLVLGYVILTIAAQHLEAASKFALVGYRSSLSLSFKQPGPR